MTQVLLINETSKNLVQKCLSNVNSEPPTLLIYGMAVIPCFILQKHDVIVCKITKYYYNVIKSYWMINHSTTKWLTGKNNIYFLEIHKEYNLCWWQLRFFFYRCIEMYHQNLHQVVRMKIHNAGFSYKLDTYTHTDTLYTL